MMIEAGEASGASADPNLIGAARPHVCFLTSSAPLEAGDAYSPFILDLAEAVTRRGFRVTILTPHAAGSATRETLRGVQIRRFRYLPEPSAETLGLDGGMLPGLRRRRFDLLKIPSLLWSQHQSLAELDREDPIDILHSHWMIPQGVIGGRFAAKRSIPHVTTAHGSDLLTLRFPGTGGALRFAARRSDLITVNSRAMEFLLRQRIGPQLTLVVPVGARLPNPESLRGNVDLRRSLPEGRHVAGFVGRVVQEKGILEFVHVIGRLRRAGLSITGLVVGGGSAEEPAQVLAEDLGVRRAIRFAGAVEPERVAGYMSVMDVVLMPSHHEAHGLVAVEAMLMGVPVVASRTGGLAEVVLEGRTGLQTEVADVQGLSDAAKRILEDPELRRKISRHAYRFAMERFTLRSGAERFERIYRRLLKIPSRSEVSVEQQADSD